MMQQHPDWRNDPERTFLNSEPTPAYEEYVELANHVACLGQPITIHSQTSFRSLTKEEQAEFISSLLQLKEILEQMNGCNARIRQERMKMKAMFN